MDEQARRRKFEDAVVEHGALVARIASSYEASDALAEELVQESFLALWRALPTFRGEASLRSFVARIAHNVAVSHVRKASRTRHTSLDANMAADDLSPEEAVATALKRRALLEAIRNLPLGQRQVLSLHLEGFSDREVADSLDLSEINVSVRLTRARERLRSLLGVSS